MQLDVLSWIERFYDCAAAPENWPRVLTDLRDQLNCAYVMVSYADYSEFLSRGYVLTARKASPWDESWLDKLDAYIRDIPGAAVLRTANIDTAWCEGEQMDAENPMQLRFYEEWVAPQRLQDCINTKYFDRPGRLMGMISVTSYVGRPDYTADERRFMELLSPHVRRAMAISDIIDKGRLAQALYRSVLDKISSAIIITGQAGRIVYANGAGEALLSAGQFIAARNGTLVQPAGATRTGLSDAVERASSSDDSLGLRGIGVPLISTTGLRAAAYVLPISGAGARREIGSGHAVTFITTRREQQPIIIEILRTLFDLTPAQAKTASLVADGRSPTEIGLLLGISVATVRSHLQQAFAKTGAPDQTSLAATVAALLPPLDMGPLEGDPHHS